MILNLLENNDNQTTVRQPGFTVSFGGGSAGGLSAGLESVVGSDDPWQRSLVTLKTDSAAVPSVDTLILLLAADDQAPSVTLEDEGTVALGYEDSSIDLVFTASVSNVKHSINGKTHIFCVNGGTILAGLRINQSYEQQTAGDIVNDLTSQAGVDTDTIEDGPEFPYYVLDDRSNAYQHISSLARKSGFLAYFTPEGKLYFGSPSAGQPLQTFNYALDIINLELNGSTPVFDSVTVIGAGAAGSQGQEAWPWLVKDPESIKVQAGSGDSGRLIRDASLRSAAAIQTAADGAVAVSAIGANSGRIVVPGAPAVVVGSTIEIADAPNAALNGNFLVVRVRHELSKQRGFISCIDFSKPSNGGTLGGPGGAL
jgi:hypothetical protein